MEGWVGTWQYWKGEIKYSSGSYLFGAFKKAILKRIEGAIQNSKYVGAQTSLTIQSESIHWYVTFALIHVLYFQNSIFIAIKSNYFYVRNEICSFKIYKSCTFSLKKMDKSGSS